ncbi:MAG: rhodanese-like domain-containing protein [Candidatus Obscuribacterales bacterium]|nr:rhodanese-like domain-containing protein [Candidatus Obscuribacterales bacterium]
MKNITKNYYETLESNHHRGRKGAEMKTIIAAVILTLVVTNAGVAQAKNYPKAKVSFDDYKGLVAEVEPHRASRLVDLDTFLKMSKDPGTIILDTRSDLRFDRIHLKGAKHLSFTDFTQENLRKLIPSPDTKILIYCNNNFEGDQRDFATKQMQPEPRPGDKVTSQVAPKKKPIMLALNIPTYINLYGYGYHNVYELDELVKVKDPRIAFDGSVVEANLAAQADAAKVCPLHRTRDFRAVLEEVDKNTTELSSLRNPKHRVWTSGYKTATPEERVRFALHYQNFLEFEGEKGQIADLYIAPVPAYDARVSFGLSWWQREVANSGRPPVDASWVHDALVDAGNSIALTCEKMKAMEAFKMKKNRQELDGVDNKKIELSVKHNGN